VKSRFLRAVFIFITSLFCFIQIGYTGELKDFPLDKIAENTYVVHGPLGLPSKQNKGFMNNPGFVVTKTGVVVVDPGSTVQVGRMLLGKIKTITSKPVTHVFNSHVHGDHWLGNQAIKEAYPNVIIIAHPLMIQLARGGEGQRWVETMHSLTEGGSAGTRAVYPNKQMGDNTQIKIGGMTFKIYAPDKAHSFTDIMLQVVEEKVVFLGDNVLYKRIGRMDDGTFRGNIAACDIALNIPALHYVPGHGQTGGKNIVNLYRTYLKTVYGEVRKQMNQGLSDFEMKPQIRAKLKSYHQWVDFDQQLGKQISLALLEAEQAEFE
jgi:glyoxylase-like metal-dependent hydrolase (beta-lactamase superfamily II)